MLFYRVCGWLVVPVVTQIYLVDDNCIRQSTIHFWVRIDELQRKLNGWSCARQLADNVSHMQFAVTGLQ